MALHKTLVLDANMKESTLSSRGYEDKKKETEGWILPCLDPRLRTSGTSVEDDRRGIRMKIANDNPKLSFLLPFCHSCSPSVIPAKAGIQG